MLNFQIIRHSKFQIFERPKFTIFKCWKSNAGIFEFRNFPKFPYFQIRFSMFQLLKFSSFSTFKNSKYLHFQNYAWNFELSKCSFLNKLKNQIYDANLQQRKERKDCRTNETPGNDSDIYFAPGCS